MLAELALANAAFSVIKEAVANSGDIMAAGESLFKYFDSKAEIQKKAAAKGGSDRGDLEEFMALEQLKLQEEELRERMIYAGRPGLWNDWLKFQAQAARRRREAKDAATREAIRRRERLEQLAEYIAIGMASIILAALLIGGIVIYMKHLR